VRLGPSPFVDARATDLRYLMAMEPDRLLAPFLREAGLTPKQSSYGNWESSGLDGHMGGHSVSIGGNSVKEHFHDDQEFSLMIDEVEGPETCNTYNMFKLTGMLFLAQQKGSYADYYERALYDHTLGSQRPQSGGFVYFTAMRPNHYPVYSQVDQAMWCCVASGIESHAKYGEFIYAHDCNALFVNPIIPSTVA
jgi:DUF1680 family protein